MVIYSPKSIVASFGDTNIVLVGPYSAVHTASGGRASRSSHRLPAPLALPPRLLLAGRRSSVGRWAAAGGRTRAARSAAMNLQSSGGTRGGKISLSRTLSRSQLLRSNGEEARRGRRKCVWCVIALLRPSVIIARRNWPHC